MTQPAPRKSDLGVRVLSAVVMISVAGAALWLGGWWWRGFVAVVALAILREWTALFLAFTQKVHVRALWCLAGLGYVGLAALTIVQSRERLEHIPADVASRLEHPLVLSVGPVLLLILPVIAVDIGAYFAGRTIGGPRIAPAISPSKTWAGLIGGMIAAALVVVQSNSIYNGYFDCHFGPICERSIPLETLYGAAIAIVAQAGDFFESWMKRSAGVKDSGHLIPGHGGLFDRADGLIAVCFATGLYWHFGRLLES